MTRDFDQSALVMFARELQAARARAGMSRELIASKINHSPSLVIDEAVLHREVGGAKVMHDQLVHLVEMSERPNVTVEVIPDTSGAHSGLPGAVAVRDSKDPYGPVLVVTPEDWQAFAEIVKAGALGPR